MGKLKKVGLGIAIAFGILIALGAVGNYASRNTDMAPQSFPVGDIQNPAKWNDVVTVDNIAYKVTNSSTTSRVGNELIGKNADGIFIMIDLEMQNNGQQSITILDSSFKLMDSKGREFSPDNSAWVYLPNNILLKQLQPNLPTKGQLIFDVPTNPESYTLEIGDVLGTVKQYITIGKYSQ